MPCDTPLLASDDASPFVTGAPANEIEVTPKMIEAGARVLYAWNGGVVFPFGEYEGRLVAERVFREMVSSSPIL